MKDKCDLLEKEKLELLRRVQVAEKELEDFKEQNNKTSQLVLEITQLQTRLENSSLRFEKLAGYDKMRVDELLESPLDDSSCKSD